MLYALFCKKLFYLICHEDLSMLIYIGLSHFFFTANNYSVVYYNLYNHFSIDDFVIFLYFLEIELENQT